MGFPDVVSRGTVTGRSDYEPRLRYRRIYLGIDGNLRIEEDGTHSTISIRKDGRGFKVGCTRVDEDAMLKIVDFVQGRPTP